MRKRLAGAALYLVSALTIAPVARAFPLVFHSESGDGTASGVVELPATGTARNLDLWLEAEHAFVGFSLSFSADAGLALVSFTPQSLGDPEAEVRFNLVAGDGGTLSLLAGNGFLLLGPRVRIGTLGVEGRAAGGRLLLAAVPGSDLPSLVNADFSLVEFELPQLLAVVPEPAPLQGLVLAWLALMQRRRASR